jgi:hypothetical protein
MYRRIKASIWCPPDAMAAMSSCDSFRQDQPVGNVELHLERHGSPSHPHSLVLGRKRVRIRRLIQTPCVGKASAHRVVERQEKPA